MAIASPPPQTRPRPRGSASSATASASSVVVPVQEEVDVHDRPLGVDGAHREVAPVLVLVAGRVAPAGAREHELAAGRRPAERDDLSGLVEPEVGERAAFSVKRRMLGVTDSTAATEATPACSGNRRRAVTRPPP
jgi:hypothetical protein